MLGLLSAVLGGGGLLVFWYFLADSARNVSLGGTAYVGNVLFLLSLPALEVAILGLVAWRLGLAHLGRTGMFWRIDLVVWLFNAVNYGFLGYLVATGAVF